MSYNVKEDLAGMAAGVAVFTLICWIYPPNNTSITVGVVVSYVTTSLLWIYKTRNWKRG